MQYKRWPSSIWIRSTHYLELATEISDKYADTRNISSKLDVSLPQDKKRSCLLEPEAAPLYSRYLVFSFYFNYDVQFVQQLQITIIVRRFEISLAKI